jgi:hypothetical protein
VIGRITKWVIALSVFALCAWTSAAVIWGLPGDSVSAHVRDYAAQYPLIPFALGVLCGHWLWAMPPAEPRPRLLPVDHHRV